VFGPTPRGYGYAFPRKKARAALAGALSAKAGQGDLVVLDALSLAEPKTKAMVGVLNRLGLDGSVLIVHRDESGRWRGPAETSSGSRWWTCQLERVRRARASAHPPRAIGPPTDRGGVVVSATKVDPHDILIAPLVTEKSTMIREAHNQIVFRVSSRANKAEVKKAVEEA
jgi:hypothetical protein